MKQQNLFGATMPQENRARPFVDEGPSVRAAAVRHGYIIGTGRHSTHLVHEGKILCGLDGTILDPRDQGPTRSRICQACRAEASRLRATVR